MPRNRPKQGRRLDLEGWAVGACQTQSPGSSVSLLDSLQTLRPNDTPLPEVLGNSSLPLPTLGVTPSSPISLGSSRNQRLGAWASVLEIHWCYSSALRSDGWVVAGGPQAPAPLIFQLHFPRGGVWRRGLSSSCLSLNHQHSHVLEHKSQPESPASLRDGCWREKGFRAGEKLEVTVCFRQGPSYHRLLPVLTATSQPFLLACSGPAA